MLAMPLHLHSSIWRRPRFQRLAVRVRAWSRRVRLEGDLAGGADPNDTPELALRAAQLTSTRGREALAKAMEHLLDADARNPGDLTSAVPPHLGEVRAARPELEALIVRLRGVEDVSPRDVATVRRLLTDGAGPLYRPPDHGAFARALRAVTGPVHGRLGGL